MIDPPSLAPSGANMSQSARKFTYISVETYLAMENDGTWRNEFVNGVAYAMAGTSDRHNLISGSAFIKVAGIIKKPCQAFMADMKVRIKTNDDERYYYPDVFVSCLENDRASHHRDSPRLIVEVLSSSTERTDRTEKFEAYTSIPTLEEYVLVSQDAVELELFRRRTAWRREHYVVDNVVTLESIGLSVSVSTFFEQVDF
jgi:Uma2 family endonuclease